MVTVNIYIDVQHTLLKLPVAKGCEVFRNDLLDFIRHEFADFAKQGHGRSAPFLGER